MIKVESISKKYKRSTYALKNVNIVFENGLYGILGRNGSGKTTLLRLITNIIEPTNGTVKFIENDREVPKRDWGKLSIFGYLPQEFGFYSNYTVEEIMQFICTIKELPKNDVKNTIEDVLDMVNLTDEKKKKYSSLSGGMKRRLGLAQALIGSPKVLIVDEPTAGVDPTERIQIRQLLSRYAENHIVLFSTHIVEDIEYTCDQVVILEKGELKYQGTVDSLIESVSNELVKTIFHSLDEFQKFNNKYPIISFNRKGNFVTAVINKKFGEGESYDASLEDAYLYVTQGGDSSYEIQ